MLDLWFVGRRFSSPFGGRSLPCPGSTAEQPAALIDAFAILDSLDQPRE